MPAGALAGGDARMARSFALEFDGVRCRRAKSRGHQDSRRIDRGASSSGRFGVRRGAATRARFSGLRGTRSSKSGRRLDAAGPRPQYRSRRRREDKALVWTPSSNLTGVSFRRSGAISIPEFLELPEEVLVSPAVRATIRSILPMEGTQHGKLLPHFLAVLNTDGDPQGVIRHGHERVLRARFNDARFFWQTDQKHPLRERTQWLKHVTFQKDLGSYYEKTTRVQRLSSWLSENYPAEGHGSLSGRDSQGDLLGEDGPDHRTGERVYRVAGNRGWVVRAGAGTGSRLAGKAHASQLRTRFTINISRNRWKTRSRERLKAPCFRLRTRQIPLPECLH